MPSVMAAPAVCSTDQACVWMRAGVLAYKLCDRGFDCEHCPLDAALRGNPWSWIPPGRPLSEHCFQAGTFPDDRWYSAGHTWVGGHGAVPGRVRFGLDCFAAALLGPPRRLRRIESSHGLEAGQTVCELDLEQGSVPLGLPGPGRVVAWNGALADSLALLVEAPYDEGWIAEIEPAFAGRPGGMFGGEDALRRARLDARRFCRGAAMNLLVETGRWRSTPPERLCAITDLRGSLDAGAFLALVRDLVH